MSISADRSLAGLTATEIAARIRINQISAQEAIDASPQVVANLNGALNASCTVCAIEARAAAAVPVGVKDVTPVAGMQTTYGSHLYADNIASEDALVVARLKKAGTIVIGKTNPPEFVTGANTFNQVIGRTRNPSDTLSAGCSADGGAAALAIRMIALAEGRDLGGSQRIPAYFCGVVGQRPYPDQIPTVLQQRSLAALN